jgi:adenylate cyclase class 2
MSKIEKEVKILNIDVDNAIKSLNKMGATDKGTKNQKLYTYDLPCISYRFDEALYLLKSKNELHKNAAKKKLELVIDECVDVVDDNTIKSIEEEMNVSFTKLFNLEYKEIYKAIISSKLLKKEIKKYKINPNKWIRLRKSNDKVELTVKHIYEKNDSKIQKVKEIEISVNDLEETNRILESIGLSRRNYQEKIRHSFVYKDAEIEIDEWPMLDPYMEIECDDENLINEIVEKLGLNNKKIVSLNTEQLYKEKGIDVLKISDLKF